MTDGLSLYNDSSSKTGRQSIHTDISTLHTLLMTALLIVDVQYDFLPPDGSLAVQGGLSILPHVQELLNTSRNWPWTRVVASQDFHPKGHISFASSHTGPEARPFSTIKTTDRYDRRVDQILWPDHCVQGTKGCEIEASVQEALQPWKDQGKFHLVQKGADVLLDAYSAFATPYSPSCTSKSTDSESPLTSYLKHHSISRLVVCGIATDVCVKATAVDAIKDGFQIILVKDAVEGVNEGDSEKALEELARMGAKIVDSVDQAQDSL